MNVMILFIAATLALSGCANEKKYKLATYRTTAAMLMYSELQTTRQVEAMSKEIVAMASMGFVEKGCGNECDKPKSKKAKAKVPKDCSKIIEKHDKHCDSAKTGSSHEEVCNDLYLALKAEQERCEEDSSTTEGEEELVGSVGAAEEGNTSENTETVKYDQSGNSEVNTAIAKATSDSAGSTVINNFIGDDNTSGSYNPSASGAGSVVMGTGQDADHNSLDSEAASILRLAGKDVESDAKEASDAYFKPAMDTAKDVAWPISAGVALREAFRSSGDKNSNNPQYDLSDHSTNINPPPTEAGVME
jgi:hypothetical protein